MSDTDETAPPVIIDPQLTVPFLGLLARNVGGALGVIVALFGFASHRDIAGLAAWLSGDGLTPFLGAAAWFIALGLSIRRMILNRRKLVVAGKAAPDTEAIVLPARPWWKIW